MPLLDHFHATLARRPWESFHARWANCLAEYLNDLLPDRYVSEIGMHYGTQVAANVAELESTEANGHEHGNGEVAVAVQRYVLPMPTMTCPAIFPDDLEVQVVDQQDGHRLVAVIELVSPSNKARPNARRAFAGKCAAYLQRGIGLVVIDIVSDRHSNLHNELISLLDQADELRMAEETYLYANAYRQTHGKDGDRINMWINSLQFGATLPTVPLALRGAWPVPLDLEGTYTEACQRARL